MSTAAPAREKNDGALGAPGSAARRWLRIGLGAITFEMLLIGLPASVIPEWFFHWFLFGRGWAGAIGPFNDHYVRDLGFMYLAFGICAGWAFLRLGKDLTRAVLLGSIVANAPHLLFHLGHTHELSAGDNIAQDSLLAFSIVVSAALLLAIRYRPEAAELPKATTLAVGDSAPNRPSR